MTRFHPALTGVMLAGLIGFAAACNSDALLVPTAAAQPDASAPIQLDPSAPTQLDPSAPTQTPVADSQGISTLAAGSLRVRCERRSGRSKISVDANNVTPRNGTFRARVRAAGGTATSGTSRAIGDEVEFDFDSNTERGATRIPANFIRVQAGADVVGQLLNAQGAVVASRGVECSVR